MSNHSKCASENYIKQRASDKMPEGSGGNMKKYNGKLTRWMI
jgi:hypothetical protein